MHRSNAETVGPSPFLKKSSQLEVYANRNKKTRTVCVLCRTACLQALSLMFFMCLVNVVAIVIRWSSSYGCISVPYIDKLWLATYTIKRPRQHKPRD